MATPHKGKGKKAEVYNLVIDRDRDLMLHAMIALLMDGDNLRNVLEYLAEKGITNLDLADFVKEKGDKQHELGWCNDPNCEFPKE